LVGIYISGPVIRRMCKTWTEQSDRHYFWYR